jgi:Zn-dependent metalloprotease
MMRSKPKIRFPLTGTIALILICFFCSMNFDARADEAAFNSTGTLKELITLQNNNVLQGKTPRGAFARPLKTATRPKTLAAGGAPMDRIGKVAAQIKNAVAPVGALNGRITGEQRENLSALTAANRDGKAVQVDFNMTNGTPAIIKMKTCLTGAKKSSLSLSRIAETAKDFLNTNKALLKLKDPDRELILKKNWTDELGTSHILYQQVVGDIPVFGKEVQVHVDGSDSVYMLNGRFEPTPQTLQTTPAITEAEALEAVESHLGVPDLSPRSTELVLFTRADSQMVLTYKIEVAPRLSEAWTYFIGAADASFVHRMTHIHSDTVSAGGTDLNSVSQTFKAWEQDGTYYLIDPTLPTAAVPDDPVSSIQSPGNTYVLSAENGESDLYHLTSTSATSGWDPAGVSTMAHIKLVYDYYKTAFNRNGIDDQDRNYEAVVHFGNNSDNAFWNGNYIVFGDGDNVTFSNLAASLDVAAHEIQHGITEFTANLKYENQSGALNEAYSDLFACMVDDDDWTMGEECTLAEPGYLRNLADPTKGLNPLPTKMSEYVNLPNTEEGDWGGVHTNMSIASRAGYLMAEGLETSIGRANTAKIWYRALTTYLTSYSQFTDARSATLQAAEDLFGTGSAEIAAVQAAWDTVEVFGSDGQQPTPGDPVAGDDLLIYLYPVDHSHDRPYNPDEHYLLYALTKAGDGYVEANVKGPLNDMSAEINLPRYTKPTAYTDANGDTIIFYVTEDFDLHVAYLYADGSIGPSEEVIDSKDIRSISISPDGRYFAFTRPDGDDNHIYLLDLVENKNAAIAIVPPNDMEGDSDTFNTILYADSLAFDFTSKTLAFDALNCISTAQSACSQGEGHRFFSIGLLSLSDDPDDPEVITAKLSFPFPNQNPNYDVSYPAFAANNSYVLAIDLIDFGDTDAIDSMVWTLNGKDGVNRQVVSPNLGSSNRGIYGIPSFWGNDDAITVQQLNDSNGSAFRAPIDKNWAGSADPDYQGSGDVTALIDHDTAMPLMHRRAARSVSGEITFSAQNLTFKNIAVGAKSTQKLTISNTSERDINIYSIAINGSSNFTNKGSNGLLARHKRMVIDVTYAPSKAGSESATLSITSDADVPTSQISITGRAIASGDGGGNEEGGGGGGGGGGGCMISTLKEVRCYKSALAMLLMSLFLIGVAHGRKV